MYVLLKIITYTNLMEPLKVLMISASVGCLSTHQKITYSSRSRIRISLHLQTFVYQGAAVSRRIQKNSADLRPQVDMSALHTFSVSGGTSRYMEV